MPRFEVTFDHQSYVFETSDENVTVQLQHNQVPITDAPSLGRMVYQHSLLLPCEIMRSEDEVSIVCRLDAGLRNHKEIQDLSHLDRLRAMINVADTAELIDLDLTFHLHPDGLWFDRNLGPKLAYRGVREQMHPVNISPAQLLRQYQCLVLVTFNHRLNFSQLYDGGLETAAKTPFDHEVLTADGIESLKQCLIDHYDKMSRRLAQSMVHVPKSKYRGLFHSTIWLAVFVAVFAAISGYYFVSKTPFDQRMLLADEQFLSNNYSSVIATLDPVDFHELPQAQKYILAVSVVNSSSLNTTQKNNILNNISLRSDTEFLHYWAAIGATDFELGLDIAKGLDELDLILYALANLEETVRHDPNLSGTQREEQLAELDAQFEQYAEQGAVTDE